MTRIIAFILCLGIASAFAQDAPTDILQRAIAALQQQRNQALDSAASVQAQLGQVADELTKARARVKELEDKLKSLEPKPDSP